MNIKDISDVKDFKDGNLLYQKYEGYEIDLGHTHDNIKFFNDINDNKAFKDVQAFKDVNTFILQSLT